MLTISCIKSILIESKKLEKNKNSYHRNGLILQEIISREIFQHIGSSYIEMDPYHKRCH